MWISGPLLLYICDAAYRSVTRQSDDACVVGVTQHPGDVIEVQLRKRGFNCTPGQVGEISQKCCTYCFVVVGSAVMSVIKACDDFDEV